MVIVSLPVIEQNLKIPDSSSDEKIAITHFRYLCSQSIPVSFYSIILSFQTFTRELTSDDEQRIKEWIAQFKLAGRLFFMAVIAQMFLFVIPK